MDRNYKSELESILFVAARPVAINELCQTLGINSAELLKVISALSEDYKARGLRIIKHGNGYGVSSAPENAKVVAKFLNAELRSEISRPALETLSIIFYKQPMTRMEIETLRGVRCDDVLRQLSMRGLIAEVGRKDAIGRPILYGTTIQFLNFMGVDSNEQIPQLDEIVLGAG